MTIKDIETLIHTDETRNLELKKTTGELKDGMKSACAFLNTDGGWLIFGIAPTTLKMVGQDVTENTRREIAQALTHLEPALDVNAIWQEYRRLSSTAFAHGLFQRERQKRVFGQQARNGQLF
jgi:ATP-dependent DNA helicase RecG